MDWLSLLFSALLIFLLLTISIQKDYASPRFLFCASLTLCVFFALLFKDPWHFMLNQQTFHVYLLGVVIFLAVDILYAQWALLLRSAKKRRRRTSDNAVEKQSKNMDASFVNLDSVLNLLIILAIIGIVMSVLFIRQNSSGESWNQMISQYRDMRVYGKISGGFLISQLNKILISAAYVFAYIVIYNKIYKNTPIKKEGKTIIFSCLALIFNTVFSGGRQGIIEFIIYCFLVYAILLGKKTGVEKLQERFLVKAALAILLAAPAFYYSSQLVGRNFSRISQFSIPEYLARYLGGGLYAFNLHIHNPRITQYWGQSSFANMYTFLQSLNILPDHIENLSYHAFERFGTTVTIFGRWYEDWGTAGVVCMSALVALVFANLYYSKIKYSTDSKPNDWSIILYAKLSMALVWAGYDDRVTAILSFSTIVILILMSIWCWLFLGKGPSGEKFSLNNKGNRQYESKYIK